ncbi:MAG TPA: hypothetical protein VFB08_12115 [Burkholderiales bacterium]|nr:hypothetical protein [Burkholderiales bacterium]
MHRIAATLLIVLGLAACASGAGYQPPRERSAADIQYEYGLHAGEPMRPSQIQ